MILTSHAVRRTGAIAAAATLGVAAIALAATSAGNGTNANGGGGADRVFSIDGALTEPLLPGVSRPLPLTITNPGSQPMDVTAVLVTVQARTSRAGCDGTTNLRITQSNVSATNPLTVPRRGSVTLPSAGVTAPTILMRDLAVGQDACRGAIFTFTYAGSASG